ncbi:MAG TPA: ATP-binding cassette domain-containing protein [Tepidisphaeraceae bacterium]|jgi:phospholipid/cholesterol/gamma-HCH transport system ATP-binding protein|nr:ATP-binding cassette domain-containing protein [Tepidisphaeraceae bacterium]
MSTPPAPPPVHDPEPSGPGTDDAIIRVENFAAVYDGKTILKDINFLVHRREILVIAGESGCGKSTLLRHIIGLETPDRGRILVEGDDLNIDSEEDRRRILRKIGVAFQSGALFGSMSVLENVALPLVMYTRLPKPIIDSIALTKLQLVGLADTAQRQPAELSGGMQKRAAIARALALDPQIIFLDEPSAALDPFTSAELDQLVLSLRKLLNMTFVIISHQLPSIFTIADHVVLIRGENKTIVADGDPKTLRDSSPDPWVRAFFNRQLPPSHPRSAGMGQAAAENQAGAQERSALTSEANHEHSALL